VLERPTTTNHPGRWWHATDEGRFQCDLCPRRCVLSPGQRAFCYVRQASEDGIELTTYGRSSGFCIDPIEKKPLNHFFPGTPVLSFGTAGCNLGCKFCQNWDISKARSQDRLMELAMPENIAQAARAHGCTSIAFTYNDPVIFAEYALDTAQAARELGLKSVAVTAGYITEEARAEFFAGMDAANIDLKAFTNDFYRHQTLSQMGPVLDTIEYVVKETNCWVELTTLLIPELNDSSGELEELCRWVMDHLGPDVPLHFSAFHPDFKMNDRPRTPLHTLVRAREIALKSGLHYVYTGNVHNPEGASTWCPGCGELLIERDWYVLGRYQLDAGTCQSCKHPIAGHFQSEPGDWGARRQPIAIQTGRV